MPVKKNQVPVYCLVMQWKALQYRIMLHSPLSECYYERGHYSQDTFGHFFLANHLIIKSAVRLFGRPRLLCGVSQSFTREINSKRNIFCRPVKMFCRDRATTVLQIYRLVFGHLYFKVKQAIPVKEEPRPGIPSSHA
jgi:hypothetical protein